MSGPKADRLKLFHATDMNLSPIFGLYPDETGEVQAKLDAAVGRALPLRGDRSPRRRQPALAGHRPARRSAPVTGLLGPKPIFIADGHHRYETALRTSTRSRPAGEVTGAGRRGQLHPDDAREHERPRPGHPADAPARLRPRRRRRRSSCRTLLGRHFEVETVGTGPTAARDTWEHDRGGRRRRTLLGFGTVADGVWQTGPLHAPERDGRSWPRDHSRAWRGLAVASCTRWCSTSCCRDGPAGTPSMPVRASAARGDRRGRGHGSASWPSLVPPATMDHVEQIAGNLEKMPPKSTYFYPKLLSGLVFNSLRGN